jgi:hypothetical protein
MLAAGKTLLETARATGASRASLSNWKRAERGGNPEFARSRASKAARSGNDSNAVSALATVIKLGLTDSEMKKFQALLAAYLA